MTDHMGTAVRKPGRPPFRADHVGSLLRPPELVRARSERSAGRLDEAELRQIEDDAICEAVRMQREVGLESATDGELRRASWYLDFIYELDGIEQLRVETLSNGFKDADKVFTGPPPSGVSRVSGAVKLPHTIFAEAFTFLQRQATDAVPKLTIPSPNMVHYRGGRSSIDENVYPDLGKFWDDLIAAYAQEVRGLYEIGCRYLQIDDVSFALLLDPVQRQHIGEIGGDPEHQHEYYIANLNRVLVGRPADLVVTTHMCRGNFKSMWMAEGDYEFVAEELFNKLEVDGFFCEWDDMRSGGFEPLRFVPKGKRVVLGLVTTKRGKLESKDDLKRRIEDAARFIDLDQLCLSPQCGFSSTVDGNNLSVDQQWAKLELVVATASEVWGSA